MASLPRPPRRCNPQAFFLTYVPSLWSAFSDGRSWRWPVGEAQIEVCVAGGTPFTLTGSNGVLHTSEGAAVNPIVRIECAMDAWQVFIGDVLGRFLQHTETHLPKAHAGVDLISEQVTPERLNAVKQRAGIVHLLFTDDAGDVSEYTIQVGDANGPSATVLVQDTDIQTILDALAADSMGDNIARLLSTRIQLQGDAAYLLRLLQGS